MSWFKKYFLNWPAPIYVLVAAAFPVLYLYANNIAETKFGVAALPLELSLAGAVVLWALLTLILRNARKAGLGTALFLFLFFTYGRFCDGLNYLGLSVPKHAYLIPVVLFVWGYCVYFISRAKRDFRTTTTVLNIVAVALLAINLFNIASYQVKLARLDTGTSEESPSQASGNPEELSTLPDIYFIIWDEYAHPDTMMEWYDYDNSEFINSLEDKGFFIASQSRTRAYITTQCLAQILNMEYLTAGWYWDESNRQFVEITSPDSIYPGDKPNSLENFLRLAYNEAADFLREKGYTFVYFGSSHGVYRWDPYIEDNADLYFNYFKEAATPWISEFQEILWGTTMLRPFYYNLVGSQYEIPWRRQTLSTVEHLKEMPDVEGPKFVFAHIFCPHQPFVFGSEGEYIPRVNWANYVDKQVYLGQYIFISQKIEEVADALLEKSEVPPIIIFQSDHGLRPFHKGIVIGPEEWHKILNAMYLPDMDYSELWDSISPVNTFRMIFNNYFDADYPLLEDD